MKATTINANAPLPSKPNPDKATFVLWVSFKDNNKRIFYSYHTCYDAELKRVIVSDLSALNKLKNLVQFKFANKYKTACIYHKETNAQLYKWVNDRLIQEMPYNVTYLKDCIKIIPL